MHRYLKLSVLSHVKEYICEKPWPSFLIQGGTKGLVLGKTQDDCYETAFFEAFPTEPSTFIRGEGPTLKEAEQAAWNKYQSILNCKGHEFERRGYKNGVGICKHCNLFMSDIFEPTTTCKVCGKPTKYWENKEGDWFCETHAKNDPSYIEFNARFRS